jgi:hypothetical protein
LKAARDHTLVRKQFGAPLSDLQSVQFKLADMATALHASRMLVRDAARKLDAKEQAATVAAAMAKQFATDNCFKVWHHPRVTLKCVSDANTYSDVLGLQRRIAAVWRVWVFERVPYRAICTRFKSAPDSRRHQ